MIRRPTTSDAPGLLAEHLDLLGREVRSGSSLTTALSLHGEPQHLAAAHEVTAAELRIAVHALDLAARRGGAEATCLHHAAAALRERAALAHEARAHAAAAWASARLLTIVPAAFAAWGVATSGSLRTALSTPAGAACAIGGAVLNAAGWRWMRTVVDEAVR